MASWLTAALATVFFISLHVRLNAIHDHLIEHLDRQTHHLEGIIMSAQQDAVNALTARLGVVRDELLSKIADLNVQIQDAGVAEVVDLSELTAAVQAIDDIVPDAENNPPF